MRELHRYLGFFLVGIMSVYAISGVVLIFRDTDFLKKGKRFFQGNFSERQSSGTWYIIGYKGI
jgi:hypothetical protein